MESGKQPGKEIRRKNKKIRNIWKHSKIHEIRGKYWQKRKFDRTRQPKQNQIDENGWRIGWRRRWTQKKAQEAEMRKFEAIYWYHQ